MESLTGPAALRESLRKLTRKLGVLDDIQSSCCGITFAQYHAIVEIGRAGSLSLNSLAEIMGLDKSAMSRTLNSLVNNRLAERGIHPEDRRYITIKLTEKGIRSYQEIEASMDLYFNQLYQFIPEAKREQVAESLQILLQALKECECCQR
ncbi:MAG: MarR family transcriptional regulator [Firmicutes bacterium]|nr:MarR family transcriptional regulator [Bacillota bacterium]